MDAYVSISPAFIFTLPGKEALPLCLCAACLPAHYYMRPSKHIEQTPLTRIVS